MGTLKIAEDIYSAGVVDWNVRHFHGHTYETRSGTSYNSYLILDRDIALVDTVSPNFADEFIGNIKSLAEPSKIKYIVANHGELDHSGCIPDILKLAPQAKVVCTEKGKESLSKYFGAGLNFHIVKSGDKISLGKKTLTFIEARMLHWPDSMYTYIPEEAILLSNDSFGQHIASYYKFEDELEGAFVMDEAKKYYANILVPFSNLVMDIISKVKESGLKINMIAPAHGLIWRKNPGKIIEAYYSWAKGNSKDKVVIIYETMYGSTEQMARAISKGIEEEGVEVIMHNVPASDRSDVLKDMLDAKGVLFGSSTHNGGMLLNIAALLQDVKGLKFIGKYGAAFGSHGWAGKGVSEIEEVLTEGGFRVIKSNLSFKFKADDNEILKCVQFGRDFIKELKGDKVDAKRN